MTQVLLFKLFPSNVSINEEMEEKFQLPPSSLIEWINAQLLLHPLPNQNLIGALVLSFIPFTNTALMEDGLSLVQLPVVVPKVPQSLPPALQMILRRAPVLILTTRVIRALHHLLLLMMTLTKLTRPTRLIRALRHLLLPLKKTRTKLIRPISPTRLIRLIGTLPLQNTKRNQKPQNTNIDLRK